MKTFNHIPVNLEELTTEMIDGKRYYSTPAGNFPSITTVLSRKKAKFIKEWRDRVGHKKATKITTQASRRGTGMHKLVEDYIDNKQDILKKAMPNTVEMFHTLRKPIDQYLDNVRGIEIPLWSQLLGVAGRCDCVAEWDGVLSIIDWKSSSKEKKEEWIEDYFLQGTAYAIMFQERTGIPVKQIVIAIAVEDSSEPQIFIKRPINFVELLKETIDNYTAVKG